MENNYMTLREEAMKCENYNDFVFFEMDINTEYSGENKKELIDLARRNALASSLRELRENGEEWAEANAFRMIDYASNPMEYLKSLESDSHFDETLSIKKLEKELQDSGDNIFSLVTDMKPEIQGKISKMVYRIGNNILDKYFGGAREITRERISDTFDCYLAR